MCTGYDASYIREVGFSVVFLGAPGIASRVLGDEWKAADGSVTRSGLLVVSVPLGMSAGFLTNSVDQLKTRIQFGQFKHLGTAFRWREFTHQRSVLRNLSERPVLRDLP